MALDIRVRRLSDIPAGKPEHLRCQTIDFAASLSEVAALRLQLSQHASVNGSVRDGEELAVELWDGGKWAEVEQGRFTVLGRQLDELDPARIAGIDVVEYVSFRLSRALLDTQSDRTFSDLTAGGLLHMILSEARGRGAIAGVTWSFTATHDSAGNPWPSKITMDLPSDQSALTTLGVLVEGGYVAWSTRGRELLVYSREDAGARRSFTIGKHSVERPVRTSLRDAATAVTLRLDDGKSIRKTGNGGLGLGVLERSLTASGVTDSATAGVLIDAQLADGAAKTELTITENAAKMDRVPLVHYDLGDWVWVRRNGAAESVRVSGVQLRRDGDGSLNVDVIVMDRLADRARRLAKRAAAVPAVAGNGRFKGAGGGGGGMSFREGIIDPAYIRGSGAPAKVSFTGLGGSYEGPFKVVDHYSPAGGESCIVGGGYIIARVLGTPTDPIGTVEYLTPAPGWSVYQPDRFGEFAAVKTESGYVALQGMLVRDETTVADPSVVAYLPGAYRADSRTVLSMAGTDSNSSLGIDIYAADGAVKMSGLTAAQIVSATAVGKTVCLTGVTYNIDPTLAWPGATRPGYTDAYGVMGVYDDHSGTSEALLPVNSGKRPESTWVGFGRTSDGAYAMGITPSGAFTPKPTIYGGQWRLPMLFWTEKDSDLAWTQLALINGYSHSAATPLKWARTPDGIVRLHGVLGVVGVANATVAILPEEARPRHELALGNGVRITRSGHISRMTSSSAGAVLNAVYLGR